MARLPLAGGFGVFVIIMSIRREAIMLADKTEERFKIDKGRSLKHKS